MGCMCHIYTQNLHLINSNEDRRQEPHLKEQKRATSISTSRIPAGLISLSPPNKFQSALIRQTGFRNYFWKFLMLPYPVRLYDLSSHIIQSHDLSSHIILNTVTCHLDDTGHQATLHLLMCRKNVETSFKAILNTAIIST